MQLKDIGEFGLIRWLAHSAADHDSAVLKGIGDDAAVISLGRNRCLLVTIDTLREGIHFSQDFTTPFLLGKKSLAVNLSDIAAMGGDPRYYFVSLSAPGTTRLAFIKHLYRGMHSRGRPWHVTMLGGDTTGSEGGISITVTVIGSAMEDRILYRHGAMPGDVIYVTGTLGDAALGLELLRQRRVSGAARKLVRRHLDPEPRIDAARMIARAKLATSMIDISDGLLADLRHIIEQSKTGALINRDAIPLSRDYLRLSASLSDDPYRFALCGGEDYELLLTAPPWCHARISRIASGLNLAITPIGEITKARGRIEVVDRRHRPISCVESEGFVHF